MATGPELSEEAWALLGVLRRAERGGPSPPAGFEKAFAELESHGFVQGRTITSKGAEAWSERFLRSDPNFKGRHG